MFGLPVEWIDWIKQECEQIEKEEIQILEQYDSKSDSQQIQKVKRETAESKQNARRHGV